MMVFVFIANQLREYRMILAPSCPVLIAVPKLFPSK